MEEQKMLPLKLLSTKNIFRGKITLKSSCLTTNERNYLIIATTAFLTDPNTLLGIEELEKMTEYLMGRKRRHRVRSGVSMFYSIIQSMVDDGELTGIGREDNIVNGILVDCVVYDNLFLYEF